MSNFACCLWWLVAGLLLGWLLSWLFDKLFRRDGEAAGVRYRSEAEALNRRVAELTSRLGDAETRAKKEAGDVEGLNRRIAELSSRLTDSESRARNASVAAAAAGGLAAAAAYGFTPQKDGHDDLELIEGIGPKINGLLQHAGINTFAKLAASPAAAIQEILDAAGPNFRLANPESWARQAALCVKGDWAALRKLQDELIAGVDPSKKRDE
jgi:predicted flap endonuclease-1-like 5' DNA nuclease